MATEPPSPPLRCLGGLPAPPDVVADIAVLSTLPLSARRQLYRVLGPCLVEPVPGSVDVEIDQFCRELSLDAAALARVMRASRFLLRQAAMLDLLAADFAADLAGLDDTGALHEALSPGYEAAKRVVRSEIARGALDDHGKVVERVAWRVDHVTASHRGRHLDVPVVVITLGYREGDRQDRVTLQLLPDALLELQAMCQQLL
jgi:hypothetical protein